MTQSSPNSLPISLEFFPPKTPEGAEKLAAVRQQLYVIRPEYSSVTYGAGGTTQGGTLQTVVGTELVDGNERALASVEFEAPRVEQESVQRVPVFVM